jgi:hypothetical protein
MSENLPVQWQEELAKHAKELASRERPPVSQIGLRAGVMMYRGQQIPGNKLDCIILSSGVERRYDTKAFDPNNIVPPDCFALSLVDEGMAPDPSAALPQAVGCDVCPMNMWQPNKNRPGKNHKPCKEKRRLVLIPAQAVREGNIKTAEMAVLVVPVTSIKHWANYVNLAAAEYSRPPWALFTEVSVNPHPVSQFEVKFKIQGPVSEDVLGELHGRIGAANEVILTPYDNSGMTVPEDKKEESKQRKF